jgi:hypothetical protein
MCIHCLGHFSPLLPAPTLKYSFYYMSYVEEKISADGEHWSGKSRFARVPSPHYFQELSHALLAPSMHQAVW